MNITKSFLVYFLRFFHNFGVDLCQKGSFRCLKECMSGLGVERALKQLRKQNDKKGV